MQGFWWTTLLNELLAKVGSARDGRWIIWSPTLGVHSFKGVSRPDGRHFLVTSLRCAQTRQTLRRSHVPQSSQCCWRRQASDPMMAPYSPPADAEGAITAHTITTPCSAQQAFRLWLGLTRLLKETGGRKKKKTHLGDICQMNGKMHESPLGGAFWAVILENRIVLWTLAADMEILVYDWQQC